MNTCIYLFIYLLLLLLLFTLYKFYGFTNPTPLTEISSSRFVRKRMYTHIVSRHMHKQNLGMMCNLLAKHRVK
jgi:hypothetical protein